MNFILTRIKKCTRVCLKKMHFDDGLRSLNCKIDIKLKVDFYLSLIGQVKDQVGHKNIIKKIT